VVATTVDYFVKSSLSSSLVFTLIQEFVLLSNFKDLRSQHTWSVLQIITPALMYMCHP